MTQHRAGTTFTGCSPARGPQGQGSRAGQRPSLAAGGSLRYLALPWWEPLSPAGVASSEGPGCPPQLLLGHPSHTNWPFSLHFRQLCCHTLQPRLSPTRPGIGSLGDQESPSSLPYPPPKSFAGFLQGEVRGRGQAQERGSPEPCTCLTLGHSSLSPLGTQLPPLGPSMVETGDGSL